MSIADRPVTHRALSAARAALAIASDYTAPAIDWMRENTPLIGEAAVRRRRRVVLGPYKRVHSLKRTLLKILVAPALALFCLIYGFFFALTAPTLIVVFVAP